MKLEELESFFEHIERDFKRGEYAPYFVLHEQLQSGIQEGLVLCKDGHDAAFSICASGHENGYVLISLLAVFPEFRGQGIGSEFMRLLNEAYDNKQGIIVEVEKPEEAQESEEREICERRIAFYERAGFQLISGIEYTIWDVPMHLMALPIKASLANISNNIGEYIYQIYLQLMGEQYIHKLKFKIK